MRDGDRDTATTPQRKTIGIIGGTGDLGNGLATRLVRHYDVIIGSRDANRAADAAAKISALAGKGPPMRETDQRRPAGGDNDQGSDHSGDKSHGDSAAQKTTAATVGTAHGMTNEEAARGCDVAILTIPDLPSDDMLLSLSSSLAGKLVICPIVPMVMKDGQLMQSMPTGSAAEKVAEVLEQARIAAGFHTVPAAKLLEQERVLDCDVLVTAANRDVYAEVAEIVSSIPRLRPLYAGPLRNSRMIEGMTPALLNVGKLNRIKSPSLRVI